MDTNLSTHDECSALRERIGILEAENARLREEGERHRGLFADMNEGFALLEVILDDAGRPADLRLLEVNDAFAELIGYPPEAMIGRTTRELLPAILPWWVETLARVALSGDPARFARYGEVTGRHCEVQAWSPRPGQCAALFRDVSEQKRAEETLRVSERRLALNLAGMTRLQALSTRLVQAGDLVTLLHEILSAASELTGTDKGNIQFLDTGTGKLRIVVHRGLSQQFVGHFAEDGCPAACGAALQRRRRVIVEDLKQEPSLQGTDDLAVLEAEGIRSVLSTPLISREGRLLGMLNSHFATPYRPAEDELGFIDLLARMAADLIERAQAEEALRQSEQRFRELADAMPQLVWTARPDGTVDYYNHRYCEFAGITRVLSGIGPEGENWEWAPVLHPDDVEATVEAWQRAVATGTTYEIEHRARRADGSYCWCLSRAVPTRDAEGHICKWYGTTTDIHAAKEAERALRESEERFRALVTASSVVLYRMSPDWSEMRQLHSRGFLANTEKPGRTWLQEYIHPDDQPHVTAIIHEAIQTKSVFELEHRVRRRDGSLGWTFSRAVPLTDVNGEIVEWFGAASDITARKQAEEALRRAADRDAYLVRLADALRPLADPVEVQAAATCVLGEHLRANRVQFAEIIGDYAVIEREYTEGVASMVGRRHISDFGEAMIEAFRAGRSYVCDDIANSGLSTAEQAAFASVGIRAYAGVPLVKSGTWVAGIGVHSTTPRAWQPDELALITETAERTWAAVERARAERALRESEEQFRSVLENSRDVIYRSNLRTGGYDYLSPSVTTLTGYTEQEIGTMPVTWARERIHPEDRERYLRGIDALQQRPPGRRSEVIEYRWRHKSGKYRWISNSRSLLTDARGRPVALVGTLRDVTERKETERQIRELNETLEEHVAERTRQLRALAAELAVAEEHERRRLARVLHDDLQQTLAATMYHLECLRAQTSTEEAGGGIEESIEMLREALRTSRSLTAELSPTILYDSGLGAALRWLGRRMEEQHGLRVVVKVETLPKAPPVSEGVKLLLYQSVRELLFNVVKHARVDEATVSLTRPTPDTVEVVVADGGQGFEVRRHIGRYRSPSGFGLFSISERLEYVGGSARIESAPGRGTRVTLSAPLQPLSAPNEGHTDTGSVMDAETEETAADSRIRILLADDHAIVRKGLLRLLQDQPDFVVVGEAGDGRAAVEMANELHPDVVLMDLAMPEMDGIEATRRITAKLPGVRIIGLSMYDDPEKEGLMRQAGAEGYIAKGGPPDALFAAIRAGAGG